MDLKMQKNSSNLFQDYIIYVSQFSTFEKSQTEIEQLLAQHSAVIVRNINSKVSYVICTMDDITVIDLCYENGIKIISLNYFEKCIKSNQLLDDTPYLYYDDDIEAYQKELSKKKRKKVPVSSEILKSDSPPPTPKTKKMKTTTDTVTISNIPTTNFSNEKKKDEDEILKSYQNNNNNHSIKTLDDSEPKHKKIIIKKGSVPVDQECKGGLHKTCHVYEDIKPWSCMLNQTNITMNNNKFYTLQLLEADNKSKYWVWTRWGRVGNKGQSKLIPCKNLAEAKEEYNTKFTEKTGNIWEKRKFTPVPGLYRLIEIDWGDDSPQKSDVKNEIEKKNIIIIPSLLPPLVKDMVDLIYDTKAMRKSMIELNYDFNQMPLGKLKKSTIDAAVQILAKIENSLNKNSSLDKLTQLSNQFYTLVPHSFGTKILPVINNIELVKNKQRMLEDLGYIKITNKVIEDTNNTENPTDAKFKALNITVTCITPTDPVYQQIKKYIKNSHAPTHDKYTLKIEYILALQRNGEAEAFKSFENMDNHQLLWHGSRMTNWVGILAQGLRIAPPEAPVTGYMFGKGIYFADSVSKSANYCHCSPASPYGFLLLCEVALGKCYEIKEANNTLSKPPPPFNSTKGLGGTAPSNYEPETGHSKCLIPSGKLESTGVKDSDLLYNEFVVYHQNQCMIRYLVKLFFTFNKNY